MPKLDACELIPVPLLDTWAQNQVRRAAFRKAAADRGEVLDEALLATWPTRSWAGCGCSRSGWCVGR